MKTWNLGNTTVRNPQRIREGLIVLKKMFEGKQRSEAGQREFYEQLVQESIIDPHEGRLPPEKTRGINGRKWASAPNQLGFCRAWARKTMGLYA